MVAVALPALAAPMVGAPGTAVTVKPLANDPLPVSGLVTTTFHAPDAAPVIGQEPDDKVVEFVKLKLVQFIVACPVLVSDTVAPETKPVPDMELMDIEPVLAPLVGEIAVTVGVEIEEPDGGG